MQQIQELQEQFNNLFEVDGDGLGQPAVDVPPSQNKIKRDRKTKDGKVELVSVEDELFPYDGNKKEQYRQKIIATINDMIQGKATLEDLLQIVRQKKAPLKEAMELMEDLYSQIEKKHGEPNWRNTRVGFVPMNKSAELTDKADKNAYNEFQQTCKREKKNEEELDKKRNETKNNPLEEAMELMEDVINELHPDTVRNALHAHNKKTIDLEDKVNKRVGEIFKKHGIEGNTYSAATPEDRKKAAETEKEIKEDPEIKDLHKQQEKRAKKNKLYVNAIRKGRETVKENLEDQIEKKFKKGEISLDKAFELAKKVESKMSQDKNNQEREDKIQKEAWKIGPNVEKAAQQRQIGKAIRRNERKNALTFEALEEALNVLLEGRKEGESQEDFKHRIHHELVRAIDKKAEEARDKSIEASKNYHETGKGKEEAIKASEKHKKEHNKLAKLDDIEPVANAYMEVEPLEDENKDGKAAQKSLDRHYDKVLYKPLKNKLNITRKALATEKFKNEALEEAMKILEDLQSKIQAQPKEKRADLEAKFAKMKQKEGKDMLQRILDRRKAMTKQEKGQEKTEERTEKALRNYIAAGRDYMDNTPSMYEFESLEEAIQLLSELFDRPDLLDDIDTTLGSPVKKTFKKIISPKKEKKDSCKENFDNSQEIGYNIEEAIKIIEAVINEVSNKKYSDHIEELADGIENAIKFKKTVRTKADRDKLDDIIIPQEHRLAVSRDKLENRIVNKAKEDERSKKDKGK